MPANRLVSIELSMSKCQLDGPEPARQVLAILRETGCEFVFGKTRDPNPEGRIRQGSIIAPMSFTHELLAHSLDSRARRQKLGGGSLRSRAQIIARSVHFVRGAMT